MYSKLVASKMCIVHTSNFSTLVIHKIDLEYGIDRCDIFRNFRTTTALLSLKVSNVYTIVCGFYRSPNDQNWMFEL